MDAVISGATSADVQDAGARVAVLPVGSFEQHGAHLPLATDTLVAGMIGRRIADDYGLFLMPPVTVSCSHEHAGMAGTVSISAATLYALVGDIWRSLDSDGYAGLVIVNGHGGNYVLGNVVQEINVAGPRVALFPGRADWQRAREDGGLATSDTEDMHGGELEASLLLHGAPEVVRPGLGDADHSAPSRPHLLTRGIAAYAPEGVIGRPSLATAAKGAAVLDSLARSAAPYVAVVGG